MTKKSISISMAIKGFLIKIEITLCTLISLNIESKEIKKGFLQILPSNTAKFIIRNKDFVTYYKKSPPTTVC